MKHVGSKGASRSQIYTVQERDTVLIYERDLLYDASVTFPASVSLIYFSKMGG